jgi:anti-sigma factor RsiW
MNCHEAESQIFAERDGTLDNSQRAVLAQHLAQCASCRRLSEGFMAAVDYWRAEAQQVRVPDAELEWQKLRREIRGGVGSGSAARPARTFLAWSAVPVAAAAALAFVLMLKPGAPSSTTPNAAIARVTNSEAAAEKSPTVVFTDEKTGWTFVVAADDIHRG